MQLSFDAADRLVELVEASHGPIPAGEAARSLFALASAPTAIARSLLDDVVSGDARLAWRGAAVALAEQPGARTALETATFVVFDLETTGLSPARSRIVEIGAQRVEALEAGATFETLVNPGVPLPVAITALTGIGAAEVRGAPGADLAVRQFLAFAGDAVLVAHNARFDMGFLDRAVERLTGRRVAAPVVDTVWLARRLLSGRTSRFGLQPLAHFFGTSVAPCHRALADASATAEILIALIGLAQERGAETVADLVELSAPRARRLHAKRSLVAGAPDDARHLPLPRRRGDRCCTSAAPATSGPGSARTSRASGSGPPSRPPWVRWRTSSGSAAAASSRPRSTSCGSCASSARLRTRAGRVPTATSTCVAAAPAGSAGPSRPLTARSRGARSPGVRPRRSTASRATIPATSCPGCDCGCGISRRSFASRTPRGCAIASRRSSRWSSGSTSSTACVTCGPVSSCRRSSTGWRGPSSSREVSSRAAPSRAGEEAASRSMPGWRTCAEGSPPRSRRRPRTSSS